MRFLSFTISVVIPLYGDHIGENTSYYCCKVDTILSGENSLKLSQDSGVAYGPFYRIGAKCGPTTIKTIYKTIKYSDIDIY